MATAALEQIAHDLGMSLDQAQLSFSIYFLGLAIGPFFLASLTEMYGRRPIWLAANCYYLLWNTICPVGDNKTLMVVGRFMSAAGASIGPVVSLLDFYTIKFRLLTRLKSIDSLPAPYSPICIVPTCAVDL
jgi:predicted MFS family arabinose efflux permease